MQWIRAGFRKPSAPLAHAAWNGVDGDDRQHWFGLKLSHWNLPALEEAPGYLVLVLFQLRTIGVIGKICVCVCTYCPTRFLLWEHERGHNGSPSLQWSVLMVCHSCRKMHVCRVILNEYLLPRWCWKLPQKLLWSIMAMSTYGLLNPQIRCCAQEPEAITFSSVRGASAAQTQLQRTLVYVLISLQVGVKLLKPCLKIKFWKRDKDRIFLIFFLQKKLSMNFDL